MKRTFNVLFLFLFACGLINAQTSQYRVVFDLTSKDSLEQQAVMRWVKEIRASNPDAQLEVVMYGKGFNLVMPERSSMVADVKAALKNPNTTFAVCEVAMKNNNVQTSQLFPGVKTVPDGIYEIISKQREGWGYIKVMH
jgi:intracellular sulfur oxidation DsrE/DsrF family protein